MPPFGLERCSLDKRVAIWAGFPQSASKIATANNARLSERQRAYGRARNSRRRVRAVVCRAEQTRQYATRACAQPAPTGNKARNRPNPPETPKPSRSRPKNSRKRPKPPQKPHGFAPSDSICTKSREGKTQKPHRIRGRAPVESVLETINALRTGNAYAHRADRTSYVPWLWGRESSSRPS